MEAARVRIWARESILALDSKMGTEGQYRHGRAIRARKGIWARQSKMSTKENDGYWGARWGVSIYVGKERM
jgi:hypothetical protein